jgi:hypothetical protein
MLVNEMAKLEKIRTKIKGDELSSMQGAKEERKQRSPRSIANLKARLGGRVGSRL